MQKVRVTLIVEPFADLHAVAGRCRERGLADVKELAHVHLLNGTVRPDQLESLKKTPGVVSVERDKTIRLPPPDNPIQ